MDNIGTVMECADYLRVTQYLIVHAPIFTFYETQNALPRYLCLDLVRVQLEYEHESLKVNPYFHQIDFTVLSELEILPQV